MCARFTLRSSSQAIRDLFGLEGDPEIAPRYNISPTQEILVVAEGKDGKRKARMAKWGLVPNWAKDPSIGNKLINAKSETLLEKPSYREAFKKRRCLIPADGFYEWTESITTPAKGKKPGRQPYRIVVDGGKPFAFAGLYEFWFEKEGADPLVTTTILTTSPNEVVKPLHDRMPVILNPADYDLWLDRSVSDATALSALFEPMPSSHMDAYPVTPKVNHATYEDPDSIEPIQIPVQFHSS